MHYTGYPLYMLIGSPFVTLLRGLGIAPAAGASAYSMVWQVAALVGVALIILRLTGKGWLAFGATLVCAVLRPIWVHGTLAEVYSLSTALTIAILWLTLDLRERWSDGKGWLLAFLVGAGVAHHRLLGLMLPAVACYLAGQAWRNPHRWRWLTVAAVCCLAGFLPYLDMPRRVWAGAPWVYGRPDTWEGFWRLFRGTEVATLQQPIRGQAALVEALHRVLGVVGVEFSGPGVIVLLAGVAISVRSGFTRGTASWLALMSLCYVLFAIAFRDAVLPEAILMTPLLLLVVLLALALSRLPARWEIPLSLALLGWAIFLGARNLPFVLDLTQSQASVVYLRQVEQLEAPDGAVVMAPWGERFFALAYGQLVEGRLGNRRIVDHRGDFAALTAADGRVYTAADTLFVQDADWWGARLGTPLRITSAGPGMLALTGRPLPPPSQIASSLGEGIALVSWEIRPPDARGRMDVVLYWTAIRPPAKDYSTFVHVSDTDVITTAADIIAQSDSNNPVYGWYPTSRWRSNEVVREDHVVTLPPDRPPRVIVVGMYSRNAAGRLERLGEVTLQNVGDTWGAIPSR